MLQHEQLIMWVALGVILGLMLSALVRFALSWRALLAAVVTAITIDYAINGPAREELDLAVGPMASDLPVHLHTCPCVALAAIAVLVMVDVMKG